MVLDHSGPMSLLFSLRTFFGLDAMHAQHLNKICSVECSIILLAASDKHPVSARDTCLLLWLVK